MFYFIVLYLLYGLFHIIHNEELHPNYTVLLLFFTFKIIINFRKCTLSYIECKLRGVKKEEGYLNQFFDKLFAIRDGDDKLNKLLVLISLVIIYYAFFIKNDMMINLLKDLKNRASNII